MTLDCNNAKYASPIQETVNELNITAKEQAIKQQYKHSYKFLFILMFLTMPNVLHWLAIPYKDPSFRYGIVKRTYISLIFIIFEFLKVHVTIM